MSLPCPFDLLKTQPLLVGCPPDDSYLMFLGGSIPDGVGFIQFSALKECLFTSLLGPGIVTFNGSQLNGSNQFPVGAMDGFNEVLFYSGINRFLNYDPNNPTYPTSEWKPLVGGGVQILIPGTYTSADIFLIFPNGKA